MERTTEENKNVIPFFRDRSLMACVADGWKIFSRNWRAYLRFQGLHLLLAAAGTALFGFLLMRLVADCLLPAGLLWREGVPGDVLLAAYVPDAAFWTMAAVGLLCLVVGRGYWKGCVYTQIRLYRATDALPEKSGLVLRRDVRRAALRGMAEELFVTGFVLVSVGLLTAAAWYGSVWLLLLLIPLAVYVSVTARLLELRFLVQEHKPGRALRLSVLHDFRLFGGFLILSLLAFLPAAALVGVASLPVFILQCSWLTDAVGVLKGDAGGLPPYFDMMYILAALLQGFIYYFAFGLQRWILALKPLSNERAE